MESEVTRLISRVRSLVTEFEQGGGANYIDEAIWFGREALEYCPPDRALRCVFLGALANGLSTRYSRFGEISDLEEAVVLQREALHLCPQDHPHRSASLNNLGNGLSTRYERFGEIPDLEEAILLQREALQLHPQGHPDRSASLNNLANHLSTWYERFGEISNLEEAIVLQREALVLHPQGHPHRSMSLSNLANHLSTQYSRFGNISDLEEAIVLHREALHLYPQGHSHRSVSLNNLANSLSTRYSRFGEISDVEEAILLQREALHLRPQGHPDQSMSLCNLAIHLSTRYSQFGDISDLEEAIALQREALQLHPQGHPHRSMSLSNLAVHLSTRYEQFWEISDLEEVIALHREALYLCPQDNPRRSGSLNNLANGLSTRYSRFGEISDVEEAIVLHREALHLHPQGHPHRSMSLNNLANSLSTRYSRFGDISDLEEAILLRREAFRHHPQGYPGRSMSLNNLANGLYIRYLRFREISNLEEAIVLQREALQLHPQGHPGRSMSLQRLASSLSTRYSLSVQSNDKGDIFCLYAQLQSVPHVVSSNDLSAARAWVRAAKRFQHPTLLQAHKTCLRFLVQHSAILPSSLPQHLPLLRTLTSSIALDAFASCVRSSSPTNAVELLEQGRGVFWAQRTSLSSPLDDVTAVGPEGESLAAEFTRLASLLRDTVNSPESDQYEQSCRLHFELQEAVTKIRELPGLSRFLLPSLFSELRRAASGGPVIIVNASKYSCDALIVFIDRDPVHIPLRSTKEDIQALLEELHMLTVDIKWKDIKRELVVFLRNLWDEIVSPIIDHLQTVLPIESRIWWCPTGEFSLLPLHAAGPFRRGERNLPQLYISSYTTTLSALIRARRPSSSNFADGEKKFVAIGQANAVGASELFSVSAELDIVRERVDGLASFTKIEGEQSCISRVVEEFGKNEWVHLACHGIPDQWQPFDSAFALHDGPFTIKRMLGSESKDAEFAYLSACHTTVGDKKSPDEALHLASAMQFIGFRSVIGTMWAVDDSEAHKVVSTFYRYMVDESGRLDHTRAAVALNRTMWTVDIPFDQRLLYVHLGA